MVNSLPVDQLQWDTEFFGFGVAKVTAESADSETLEAISEYCLENGIRVAFYLIDADDVEAVHVAEDAGFRLVDDRLTLQRDLEDVLDVTPPAEFILRSHESDDISKLRKIARDVFQFDRFHADPKFDSEACDEMRATWTENLCGDLGDRVIVAEDETGSIGGYIGLQLEDGTGKIVLTGVAEDAQGRGLGRVLTAAALNWFVEMGCESAKVVTQSRNIAAQYIYQEMGFRTIDSAFWFHKWFE